MLWIVTWKKIKAKVVSESSQVFLSRDPLTDFVTEAYYALFMGSYHHRRLVFKSFYYDFLSGVH